MGTLAVQRALEFGGGRAGRCSNPRRRIPPRSAAEWKPFGDRRTPLEIAWNPRIVGGKIGEEEEVGAT